MQAIKILDKEPGGRFLAVDLRHVLDALGQRALDSTWRIDGLWTTPETDDNPLEKLATRQKPVPGQELVAAAHSVDQVIDGEFVAFDPDQDEPWVTVEAVDSSYYRVRSEDSAVLSSVREHFRVVSDCELPAD